MANTCKTCKHPEAKKINDLLSRQIPLSKIVAKYGTLSLGGVQRHKERCNVKLFAEVLQAKRDGLLASVDEVKIEIETVKTEFCDNPNVRLGLIGKMLDAIEKEAKLTGAYIKDQTNPKDEAQRIADLAAMYEEAGLYKGEDAVLQAKAYVLKDVQEVGTTPS